MHPSDHPLALAKSKPRLLPRPFGIAQLFVKSSAHLLQSASAALRTGLPNDNPLQITRLGRRFACPHTRNHPFWGDPPPHDSSQHLLFATFPNPGEMNAAGWMDVRINTRRTSAKGPERSCKVAELYPENRVWTKGSDMVFSRESLQLLRPSSRRTSQNHRLHGNGESLHFQVTQIWMLMWLVLWQEGCGTFWGFQFREPPDKSCAPRILQLTFAPDFGFTKIQRADLPSGLAHASEARLQQAPVCILWKGQ